MPMIKYGGREIEVRIDGPILSHATNYSLTATCWPSDGGGI